MILVYPKLETPDVYVDPKTKVAGKPAYKTDAKNPEGSQAIEKAQAFVLKELVRLFPDMDPSTRRRTLPNGDTKTVHWPFKVGKDGVTTITAKTARTNKQGELMRVPMFGANNKKLPETIYPGGGSLARLDLTLNAMPNDGGINCYINAIQVLKLEESSFGKNNFEPTDGYVYEAEVTLAPNAGFQNEEADESDAAKF